MWCLAFVICKVLVKNIEKTGVNYDLKVPHLNNDTTLANNVVFVKYDDYNFYPEFIVHYENYQVKKGSGRTGYFDDDYVDYDVGDNYDIFDDYNDYYW